MATTVRAQTSGAHFQSGPTANLDDTGDYCVTFDEAGLGKTVTYTITAGEGTTFTFRCFTKSGNKPQEAPNSVSGSNDLFETTVHPKSGRFMGTLCLQPQQDGASCQGGGLVLKLIAVDYKGVVFCDSTNNLCFEMPIRLQRSQMVSRSPRNISAVIWEACASF
jgi:hypothetical protein